MTSELPVSIEAAGRAEEVPVEAVTTTGGMEEHRLTERSPVGPQGTSVPGEERSEVRTDTGANPVTPEGLVASESRLVPSGPEGRHRVERASPTPNDRSGLGEEDRLLAKRRRQIAEDDRVQARISAADNRAEREKNLRLASEKRLQLLEAKNRELAKQTEDAVLAVMSADHRRDNEARRLMALQSRFDRQESEIARITALYEKMLERIAATTGCWPDQSETLVVDRSYNDPPARHGSHRKGKLVPGGQKSPRLERRDAGAHSAARRGCWITPEDRTVHRWKQDLPVRECVRLCQETTVYVTIHR